ncbi:C45 family autoproteolytic acyltransferase/hydrolase [Streptomyces sp. NPDC020412]|uniref:C45 family autoproteolytic acyltransferase/hydolase n=1 Tax=Streptomyces sp. NPDC020412 TaxID=3365073 RepID=UPI00379D2632
MNAEPQTVEGLPAEPLFVRTSGSPLDRGRQYGTAARTQVLRSLEHYERVYAKFADVPWDAATALAETFVPVIEAFDADHLEEMQGIAEGAGVTFADVLALNLRTEILFSGKARKIAAGAGGPTAPPECTAFVDLRGPEPVVGQNWDWIPFAHGTVVVLETEPTNGPRWVSVVEAGLLAKFGMNSAGLTVLTNALVTSLDVGSPGMPYHLLLRALLESESLAAAEEKLRSVHRSSSANYLLVGDGRAVDVETRPGGANDVSVHRVDPGGLFVHTNHFVSDDSAFASTGTDLGPTVMADTLFRRARTLELAGRMPQPTVAGWHEVLGDHENYPEAVCCHPNPAEHALEQGSTVASAVIEPERQVMHLALGHPCTTPRAPYGYRPFFKGLA